MTHHHQRLLFALPTIVSRVVIVPKSEEGRVNNQNPRLNAWHWTAMVVLGIISSSSLISIIWQQRNKTQPKTDIIPSEIRQALRMNVSPVLVRLQDLSMMVVALDQKIK